MKCPLVKMVILIVFRSHSTDLFIWELRITNFELYTKHFNMALSLIREYLIKYKYCTEEPELIKMPRFLLTWKLSASYSLNYYR